MRPKSSVSVGSAPVIPAFPYSLPAEFERAVKQLQSEWDAAGNTGRLWKRDASLWTNGDEGGKLGWLSLVEEQLADVSKFKALAAGIREDGFRHILLLGTGGASLAAAVFAAISGKQPDSPELLVLDSTDPTEISSVREKIDPAGTLFCVSSKSGTILETDLLLRYFHDQAQSVLSSRTGHNFVAITDPGSKLEALAAELNFRRVFHVSASVSGSYSALSDFGLVPHAAMNLDTENLLKRTEAMVDACRNPNAPHNPGVALGLILAASANAGRDKVTLICSESIRSFGSWLEQVLAESTGKQGRGLIPVDGEPLLDPRTYGTRKYGRDRLFVYIRYAGDSEPEADSVVDALEKSGEAVVRLALDQVSDLGRMFFQWQIAAAVAASVLGVNPFDRPDIEASKTATLELTGAFERAGALKPQQSNTERCIVEQDGIQLFADAANAEPILRGGKTIGAAIRAHLDRLVPGDYLALLAFLPRMPEYEAVLQSIREQVVESKEVATVLGFGPRFLHGAGQLYKGGPNSGVFVQITCDHPEGVRVPGHRYSFGVVEMAQALGDLYLMELRNRRVLRVHLGADVDRKLNHLRDVICAAIAY